MPAKSYKVRNPDLVQAIQFDGTNAEEIVEWADGHVRLSPHPDSRTLYMRKFGTKEFTPRVIETDWVYRTESDEFWSLDDAEFRSAYEEA